MELWRPLAGDFLDGLLRRDGLGDAIFDPACACCQAKDGIRLFRCDQCGSFLQCADCVRSRHQLNMLHCLREWNGEHWIEATLSGGDKSLGLVYQVGHYGFPCRYPKPERSMVVMDVTGIHTITFCYCGCEKSQRAPNGEIGQLLGDGWYPATTVDPETCATLEALETFRLLNVIGNITVHDFVSTLERKTDPTRVSEVPDRYKTFGRIARQFGYLLRAKRAGCRHDPEGLSNTADGALAVPCWPCPHDGKNLPDGWRDVDPELRYVFGLSPGAFPLSVRYTLGASYHLRAPEMQRRCPEYSTYAGYLRLISGPRRCPEYFKFSCHLPVISGARRCPGDRLSPDNLLLISGPRRF
ncbi:hypothetical protein DFH06DRAFT_1013756 [Mycena polygramma]|nr:hypothetical protein DFH06DRAFT_1013756 [Mycena polygramma]